MGDVRTLLNLPKIGQPPWWLTAGDRPCWFTLPMLLQRTQPVATASK